MKIALAQIDSNLAQFQRNLQKHLAYIQMAVDAGAEMVIFPEMALTGYSLQDLSLIQAIPADSLLLDPLRKASEKIDIIVSFPEKEAGMAYIASSYISLGSIQHTQRKCYLPINGFFNDRKDFKPGRQITSFPLQDGHIASMLICRDIWYADTVLHCAESGTKIIITPSAVPLRNITEKGPGISAFMERTVQSYAEKHSLFFIFANRVGFEEGICFYGGSLVVDPFGKVLIKGPYLEEQLLLAEIAWSELERKNRIMPLSYEQLPYSALSEEVP